MTTPQKKILIIEDEKAIAHALELKFTHAGFATETIYNGEGVLERLKGEDILAVLLDLVMPRVDGFEVLAELQKEKIELPIFVLTNLSQGEDREKALALGARDVFVKSNTSIVDIVNHVTKVIT